MISETLQEIRRRAAYVAEVQEHVGDVLVAFQQDAQSKGAQIIVNSESPDVSGIVIEIVDRGQNSSSRMQMELNLSGEMTIWRENSLPGDDDKLAEKRTVVFSKTPMSSAVDVLLAMADEHMGFVGTKFGAFLEAKVFGSAPDNPDLTLPEP